MELCESLDVKIIEGAIASDHVPMYLSMPPKCLPSGIMKVLKGKSAEYLRRDFPELNKKYLGMHILAMKVLCGYRWHGLGNYQKICQRPARRPNKREAIAPLEGQQRMTRSGVVVQENHRQGRW
jgi:hypothetical protein